MWYWFLLNFNNFLSAFATHLLILFTLNLQNFKLINPLYTIFFHIFLQFNNPLKLTQPHLLSQHLLIHLYRLIFLFFKILLYIFITNRFFIFRFKVKEKLLWLFFWWFYFLYTSSFAHFVHIGCDVIFYTVELGLFFKDLCV